MTLCTASNDMQLKLWDLVEIRGSYIENEWKIYQINDDGTVYVISKFNREVTIPVESIIGVLDKEEIQ